MRVKMPEAEGDRESERKTERERERERVTRDMWRIKASLQFCSFNLSAVVTQVTSRECFLTFYL